MNENRALKILHLASHEINVGDGALNDAIRSGLRRLAGRPVEFDLQDVAVGRPALTAEAVDRYDLVVVGGGGGISNGPHAADSGTAMPISFEEYRRSRVPFAFVALGHNVFEGDPFRHGRALTRLLEEAALRGHPFSVRNDGSLARLHRDLGAAADTVVEIPDPGFFVDAPLRRPVEASARPYVLIQVAGDSLARRVKVGRLQRAIRRLRRTDHTAPITGGMIAFGLHMWRKHGVDILVAPHIPTDVGMSATILRGLYSAAGPAAAHRPFRLGGTPHPGHSTEFFGAYAGAELVVGMRGHSVICGVGLRRPTLALSTHPKIAGFMETCGLGDWSVPFGPAMAGDLSALADGIVADGGQSYFAKRDPAVAGFSRSFDDFLKRVLSQLPPRT